MPARDFIDHVTLDDDPKFNALLDRLRKDRPSSKSAGTHGKLLRRGPDGSVEFALTDFRNAMAHVGQRDSRKPVEWQKSAAPATPTNLLQSQTGQNTLGAASRAYQLFPPHIRRALAGGQVGGMNYTPGWTPGDTTEVEATTRIEDDKITQDQIKTRTPGVAGSPWGQIRRGMTGGILPGRTFPKGTPVENNVTVEGNEVTRDDLNEVTRTQVKGAAAAEEEEPKKKKKYTSESGNKRRRESGRTALKSGLLTALLGAGAFGVNRSAEKFLPRDSRLALDDMERVYTNLQRSQTLNNGEIDPNRVLDAYARHGSRLANAEVAGTTGKELIKLLRMKLPVEDKWQPHLSDAHYDAFSRGPAYGLMQLLDEKGEEMTRKDHIPDETKKFILEKWPNEYAEKLEELATDNNLLPLNTGPSLRESLAYYGGTMDDGQQNKVMQELLHGDDFNKGPSLVGIDLPWGQEFPEKYQEMKEHTADELMNYSFPGYIDVGRKAKSVHTGLAKTIPAILGLAAAGAGGYGLYKGYKALTATPYEKRRREEEKDLEEREKNASMTEAFLEKTSNKKLRGIMRAWKKRGPGIDDNLDSLDEWMNMQGHYYNSTDQIGSFFKWLAKKNPTKNLQVIHPQAQITNAAAIRPWIGSPDPGQYAVVDKAVIPGLSLGGKLGIPPQVHVKNLESYEAYAKLLGKQASQNLHLHRGFLNTMSGRVA